MNKFKSLFFILLALFSFNNSIFSSSSDIEGENPFVDAEYSQEKTQFNKMLKNLWVSTGIYLILYSNQKSEIEVSRDMAFENIIKYIQTNPNIKMDIDKNFVNNIIDIEKLQRNGKLNSDPEIVSLIEKNSTFWKNYYRGFIERSESEGKFNFTNTQKNKIATAIKSVASDIKHDRVEKAGVPGWQRVLMILIGLLLLYLAISKGFEPLLLVPIGFGGILANIPGVGIAEVIEGSPGFLKIIFDMGIANGLFPLLIFLGVGAMTDFGPLIANPKTALLGAGAQFGIFTTLMGALLVSGFIPGINFSLKDACSIGIIGGADGPTAIFLSSRLSPNLLGAIAVAAYSYMALVPVLQPPVMKLLTTKKQRMIKMTQLRHVSKTEKILFPIGVLVLCILLLPSATPLVGMLMLGNLFKESGVVDRLSKTAQNELINIVTILLGLSVGTKLAADKFLSLETLGILVLGCLAFMVGTAGGVIVAHILNLFSKNKVNPLIGAAGVSAVPMAARVVNKVGQESDPSNFLLMHAMGPNVSGVIGSATVAGILLSIF